jgi:hypothetical protein
MGGCNETELKSSWRDRAIVINGSDSEWQGMTYWMQKSNVVYGICNDEQYLYMCLVLPGRQAEREIMGRGFTVWCDANGGNDKLFGIHFPLGYQEAEREKREPGVDDPDEQGKRDQMFQQMTSEMEILGPGKEDRVRMSSPGAKGIKVQFGHSSNGNLVYELKIPLRRDADQPYAINTDTGKTIGIGFEIAEANRGTMKRRTGEDESMSGGGRGGGGRSGRGGGGARGGRVRGGEGGSLEEGSSSHEPFNLWIRVALAGMPSMQNK